jgi:electron transfer flavoprotein beta subunit
MTRKITVCFKAVPEFEQVVDADWDHFSCNADWGYVKRVFGCFDESALETALRLRSAWEAAGVKAECTALTAGPLPPSLCTALFAAGFDQVLELSGDSGAGGLEFRPRYTAALLGGCLRAGGFDLILAGRQTGYADTGTVPLLLAEALGVPVVTGVEELAPCAGGVEALRSDNGGRERLRVRLPVVAVLGNSPVSALRAATLRDRMAASKRSAEGLILPVPGEDDGERRAAGTLRVSREKRRGVCRFLPGGGGLAQSVAGIREDYLGRREP